MQISRREYSTSKTAWRRGVDSNSRFRWFSAKTDDFSRFSFLRGGGTRERSAKLRETVRSQRGCPALRRCQRLHRGLAGSLRIARLTRIVFGYI
jgi:hypothetical protein